MFGLACASLSLVAGCLLPGDEGLTGTGTTIGGESSSTDPPVGCDGVVVALEACDDGNALDGDGSLVWCKAEIGPGPNNIGVAVATDSAGNAIVVGRAHNPELDGDAPIVIKVSGDGSLLWTRTLEDRLYAMGVVTRADDSIVRRGVGVLS